MAASALLRVQPGLVIKVHSRAGLQLDASYLLAINAFIPLMAASALLRVQPGLVMY